jgi:hypothetical protein
MQNQSSRNPTLNLEAYVNSMATVLLLDLPPEIRPSIIENFERIAAIAAPLLEFELPDTIESAPTFQP